MSTQLLRRSWTGPARLLIALCGWTLAGSAAADAILTPTFTTAPASYTPGTTATNAYVLEVENSGDTIASGAGLEIDANFPGAVAWTCAATGTGSACGGAASGNSNNLDHSASAIGAGGKLTYTFGSVGTPASQAGDLVVRVDVADGDASTDAGTSFVETTATRSPITDFGVGFSPAFPIASPGTYTPGTNDNVVAVQLENHGPSDSAGATLSLPLPAGASATFSCSPQLACGGLAGATWTGTQAIDLDDGETATVTLLVDYPAGASAASIDFVASITGADPEPGTDPHSNTATNRYTLLRRADWSAQFAAANPASYVPGVADQQLVLTVANAGPSNSSGATLSITLPTDAAAPLVPLVSNASVSCSAGCGSFTLSGATLSGSVARNAGQSSTVTLEFDVPSAELASSLQFQAAIASADDITSGNNSDSDSLAIDRRADIEVQKTASASLVNPGNEFHYDIVVTNNGPSDVGNDTGELGVLLDDDLATVLDRAAECDVRAIAGPPTAPCWEYCAAGGLPDSCVETVNGSGDLVDVPIRLAAGQSVQVRVYAGVGETVAGTVDNTASVARAEAAVQEPSPSPATPDSDSVAVLVELASDVLVEKTDDATSAVPGEQHAYRVTVRNQGFITVNGVALSDTLPLYGPSTPGFVPGTLSWQCQAFNGACCNSNSSSCGAGAATPPVFTNALASHGIDLPGQSHVVFTFTGTLDPRATGTLSNTASIAVPADFSDPVPGNNSATDANTVLTPRVALDLEKRLLSLVEIDGGAYALEYEIVVANGGPSRAAAAAVSDVLDSGSLDVASAQWSCSVQVDPGATSCADASGTGSIATTVDLDVGGRVAFLLTVQTLPNASGEITNTARVSFGSDSDEDTVVSGLAGEADLAISKTDGLTEARPGTDTEYRLTVRNLAGDDVFGARVVDVFARELEGATWTCDATTPIPGDLALVQRAGPAATQGQAIAVTSDGRHAYQVANASDSVFAYDRNNVPGTGFGTLTHIETETEALNDAGDPAPAVAGLDAPIAVAMSADNLRVFVLSAAAIAVFDRDAMPQSASYGRLSFAGAVTSGVPAAATALVATAEMLYVAGAEGVALFKLDNNGGLPLFDTLHQAEAGWQPLRLAVAPAQRLLFVASTGAPRLRMFALGSGGGSVPPGRPAQLAALDSANYAAAAALVLGPEGDSLYLASPGAARLSVVAYTATAMSAVTSYSQSLVAALSPPSDPFASPSAMAIAADGEHLLYSARASNMLLSLRRDTDSGLLVAEDLRLRSETGSQPAGQADALLVTPDGRHLLVASGAADGEPLQVWSRRAPDPLFALVEVDRNGDLGPPAISGLQSPTDVATSPDGEHVYAVSLADDALSVFRRFPTQGMSEDTAGAHLQFVARYRHQDGVPGLDGAHRVRVSPDGARVYVTSEIGNSLSVFDRAANGTLTHRQLLVDGAAVPALSGANGMAIDGSSSHLYVAAAFDNAIATFAITASGLEYRGQAKGGVAGVTGMDGVRDVALSANGRQLLGVSGTANTLVVFNREDTPGAAFGQLGFVQALPLGGAQRPVSLSLPQGPLADAHVYVAAENTDSLVVLRRIVDPTSANFGQVLLLGQVQNGVGGIAHMDGPRDVQVSPDGKRVYVAARNSSAVLIFDRDLNPGSAAYGQLTLREARRDGVDGVDGIASVYAVAVSNDSRHVYAAGFGDQALASFAVGSGSSCSAGGSGAIDDRVNVGAGGTLEYRVRARIRPDASGTLSNTASVVMPERFEDTDGSNNSATDTTLLVAEADLSVSKTNDQVSVVAGQPVTYEVLVRNPGPSNLRHAPGAPVTLSDPLPEAAGFLPASATWTCTASGSGALDFVEASVDGAPGLPLLGGASGLALVPDADGAGPLGSYLAVASVLDDALVLLRRDPLDGRLLAEASLAQGEGATSLAGARAVLASPDGRFLYVASRTSDAVTVLSIGASGGGLATLTPVQVQQGVAGLDQALHLAMDPTAAYLYVAGANDNAVAVFARDVATGQLTFVESERDGIDDATDAGGTVAGLANVQFVAVSPDGAQLYALSGSGASIARFDRDAATGRLSWRAVLGQAQLPNGVSLAGASSASFDADGSHVYVTATEANRVLVFARETGGANAGRLAYDSQVVHGVGGASGLQGPRRAVFSADFVHLYVTAQGGSSVAWFVRDPADARLRYLGQRSSESAGVSGLGGATGIAIDAELDQVYVAGTLDGAVAQFERQADSWCPPSGSGPLLAVPFDIAAGGSVRFEIHVDVQSGLTGPLVNTATLDVAADPNGANDSATDTDVQSVVADLSIAKDDGLAEIDGLAGATAIVGDADHLYVAGAADNAIGVFARQPDAGAPGGERARFVQVVRNGQGGVLGLRDVSDVLLSSDGAHVYATSPTDNSVASYQRHPADGRLAFLGIAQNELLGVTGLAGAAALAESPDGRHVYVAGNFSNAIAVFAREATPGAPTYGQLSFRGMVQNGVAGVQGIGAPVALAVSPDGKHVYVLGSEADSIAVFVRNTNPGSSGFGNLTWSAQWQDGAGGVTGLAGVRSLALTPAGDRLYVLGAEVGAIAHFDRNTGTGALTFVADLRDGDAGVDGLAGARRLRMAPGGDMLYVAAADIDALLHLGIDGAGALALQGSIADGDPAPLTGGQVLGLDGASDLFVDAAGSMVFSASATDAALASFGRDPGDGALSFHGALFDGLGGVAPGDAVRYIIQVDNLGPSDVPQARVVDTFPDAFSSVSWTCSGSGGGQCTSTGTGSIDRIVNLPVGGRVVFLADGVVGESATGRLVNTATVAAIGAVDPNEQNNSATDGDTVLSPAANLVVTVDDGSSQSVPGGSVDYLVDIANLGPSYAEEVRIGDTLPAALHDVAWTCQAQPVAGVLSAVSAIATPLDSWRALAFASSGQHAYAAGSVGATGALAFYRRDTLSGSLAEVERYDEGAGVAGIAGAAALVLSKDERFVFVAGADSDAIAVFERDATSGALSWQARYQDGESGIEGLGGVSALALSPDGKHLYAAGTLDDAISVFAVHAASGGLSLLGTISQAQPGMDGLNGVNALAFDAAGEVLFATAADNQSLAAFARGAGGLLSPLALVQDFELAERALLAPASVLALEDAVLVADPGSDRVTRFAFAVEGGFTAGFAIAEGLHGISGISAPQALAFDPEQARLYVAGGDALHLFSLEDTTPRQLDRLDAATIPVLTGVAGLLLSPDREQLYGLGAAGIGTFSRERGSRCGLSGNAGLDGQRVDIAPGGSVAFHVSGAVFANAAGSLDYTVSAATRIDGEELDPSDNEATDSNLLVPAPDLAAVKSDGRTTVVAGTALSWRIDLANAGVSDALGAIAADPVPVFPAGAAGIVAGSASFSCSTNLPLGGPARTATPALAGVAALALSAQGDQLFAANPATDSLLVFPRAPDGALAAPRVIADGSALGAATADGLDGVSSLAVTPDGRHLLVTGGAEDSLTVFTIGAGGDLAFVQLLRSGQSSVAGLRGPQHVVVARDGRRVFVASALSHAIAVFGRDPDTGTLQFIERVADGLGTILPDSNVLRGVRRLHLSADGLRLYAVAELSQAVSSFAVDADSGRLSYLGKLRQGEAGIGSLGGARDLVGAPGDDTLYALGSSTVTLLVPDAEGMLVASTVYSGVPELANARAVSLDRTGSRLYVTDGSGDVHVFARDWNNGALELRHRHVDPLEPAVADAMLHAPGSDLYLAMPAPGGIERLDVRALSRCLVGSGTSDAPLVPIDLGVGGWARIDVAATVHPSARGVIANTATFVPADGTDPSPSDNAGLDNTTIRAVSDLSISKQAPPSAVAGEAIAYTIQVGNAGPSSALGLRVQDTLPAALQGASWTCSATTGSACPASGSGNLDVAADLLPGGSLSIVVNAQVAPQVLGSVTNTATVVMEPGATDPTTGDHQASASTEVSAEVSVSVDKSNGVDSVVAGATTTWQIVVANAGPSDAPAVALLDVLPAGVHAAQWTCSADARSSCPTAGTGGVDVTVSVAAGEAVRVALSATVDADLQGTLANTASATLLDAAVERLPGDESDTDTDTVTQQTGLSVQLATRANPFDPASAAALPIELQVANAGPSLSRQAQVLLGFSAPVTASLPSGCAVQGPTAVRCVVGPLEAGSARNLTLGLAGLPAAPGSFQVQASVSGDAGDPQPADDSDTLVIALQTGGDVMVRVDNGRELLEGGSAVEYTIEVTNLGSVAVQGIVVQAPIAAGLVGASWTCLGTGGGSCTASGSGGIVDALDLASGQGARYRLQASIDPALDPHVPQMVAQSASAQVPAGSDFNLSNNDAVDEDLVMFVVFYDGFEDAPAAKAGTHGDRLTTRECSLLGQAGGHCPAGKATAAGGW